MESIRYVYDGKVWRPSATTTDVNNFLHATFGERVGEDGAYFDRLAQFRRMRWGTFLTYFVTESMPSSLAEVLNKCWSAKDRYEQAFLEDKRFFLRYVTEVMSAEKPISIEEISILATLENIKIVVFSESESNLPVAVLPNADILGGYPNTERSKDEVFLCLKGNIFYRLEPVDEDTGQHSKTITFPIAQYKVDDFEFEEMQYTEDFAEQLSSNSDKYEKGGSAGSKGVEFQINILTLFLLNAMRKLKNWRLSTENKAAGKFDDVVLECADGCILLQAKRKEGKSKKVTFQDLMSTNSRNDDFSLPKYYLSFEEIKSNFKLKNVIICTNAGLDGNVMKFVGIEKVPSHSMLYSEGYSSFVTFKEEVVPHLKENIKIYYENNTRSKSFDEIEITDEKLKYFLRHLQVYPNYLLEKEIELVAEYLLKNSENLPNTISYSDIYAKVMEWFQQKNGVYFTEVSARATFSEIRRDKYWQKLDRYDVDFLRNDYNFQVAKTVFHIIVDGSRCLLQEIKIHRSFKEKLVKVLYIWPSDEIATQIHTIESFGLVQYTHLVIITPKAMEDAVIKEICHKLREILNRHPYKKVIMVAPSNNTLPELLGINRDLYVVVNRTVTFQDFSDDTRKILVNKKQIIFQGKIVTLEELLMAERKKDYAKFLSTEITERLINDESISVGTPPCDLEEHVKTVYVNRKFQGKFDKFNKKIGAVFPEENIYEVKNKMILISDSAGAGKSTVLTKIATEIKQNHPHLWVIRVKLSDCTVFFNEMVNEKRETITLMELLNSTATNKFSNDLQKEVFAISDKVVLLLDGFDEISPDYTKLVVNLFVECKKACNLRKVFITTRPHHTLILKSKLSVKTFVLQPFTERDQTEFLTNYWMNKLNLDATYRDKCELYAEALIGRLTSWILLHEQKYLFSAIPLHVTMLGEIFQENNIVDNTKWQGCKEYLNGNEQELRLPEKVEISSLYDMFIEKKRDVFVRKGNPSGNPAANKALVDQFDRCLDCHRSIALEIFFDQNTCKIFSCYREIDEGIKQDLLRVGMVQELQNELRFVHRTFAEYFVAECLLKELVLRNQNQEFRKIFLMKVLRQFLFHFIRIFLDSLLNRNMDSLSSDIFQTNGGVDAVEYSNLKFTPTPLSFTVKHGHLNIAKFLVKQGANVNAIGCRGRAMLFDAITNQHSEVVKFLVENGATVSLYMLYLSVCMDQQDISTVFFENVVGRRKADSSHVNLAYGAAFVGRLDVLRIQMERGLDVNQVVGLEESLLSAAARGGRLDVIEYLARQGAAINCRGSGHDTALHKIARKPSLLSAIKLLVELGTDVNLKNYNGFTPLHLAAQGSLEEDASNLNVVQFLAEHGADYDAKDRHGRTAAHLAASEDQPEILEFFLGLGTDVGAVDSRGRTLLHHAASSDYLKAIKYVADKEVDLNAKDENGETVLHSLVTRSEQEMIELLLDKGADVDIKNNDDRTALHLSARRKDWGLFELLVKRGADINIRTKDNRTALHLACAKGPTGVVELLAESGADVNAQDSEGCTALHLLSSRKEWDSIRVLLKYGADINVCDGAGRPALHGNAESDFEFMEVIT